MHDFTLVFQGIPDKDGYDRIFEAGCDDTQPEEHPENDIFLLRFMREADSFMQAVSSALRNLESTGYTPVRLQTSDTVWADSISERVGITVEELSSLVSGEEGPGGFPATKIPADDPEIGDLYSWEEVSTWFSDAYGMSEATERFAALVEAADHFVRCRAILAAIGTCGTVIFQEFQAGRKAPRRP